MTVAAQSAGGSRRATTNAARLQSSAKASAVWAIATIVPSARRAMQPTGSQTKPLAISGSLGCARVAVRAEPIARRKGLARRLQHREAAVRPAHRHCFAVGGDEHIRPRGRRRQHRGEQEKARPAPPQRRTQQADHDQAKRRDQQRSDAEGRYPPDRAGQACDPQRDPRHPVDAVPHQPPHGPVEAERQSAERKEASRHHERGYDRHGQQICEHAVRREPVEMIGGEHRRREAGDQGSEHERRQFARAPEREPRAERSFPPAAIHGMPRS